MIMFLLRSAFWLCLVILILPIDKEEIDPTITQSISAGSVLQLAGGAVSDISQICQRKPDFCIASQEAFMALGVKAHHFAGLAYDYFNHEEEMKIDPASQQN